MLYWLDENRLTFASDYAIWTPKWLIERFMGFEMPDDMVSEYGELTKERKAKVLGLNAAALYGIEVPSDAFQPEREGPEVSEKPAVTA